MKGAIPYFKNADDMIIYDMQSVNEDYKKSITVVTSDRELKLRLQQLGIN